MKSTVDYVSANTNQALLKMTMPLLIALILNMSYSITDSLWIGNLLGKQAMAALTSSTAVILLLTCIIVGLTNGIAILLAQAIGAKDEKRISKMKTTSFIFSLVFIILIIVICQIGVIPILKLLHTPDETLNLSCWYLRIYLLGVLPSYFYMYFTTILRCYGNTVFQMIVITITSLINVFLDPLLMHPFGFNGVAIATVITQSISLVVAIIYIFRKQYFHIKQKDFEVKLVGEILSKGIPTIVQQSIPAISTMALTTLVSGFGLNAIAAFGIVGKMENILLYPVMALNMGLTTIVSRCVGSKRIDRMDDYIKCGIKYGGLSLLILSTVMILFSKNISWLFLQDTATSSIVQSYFYIAGIGYIIHAVTTCFLAGLNGMGKTTYAMLLYIGYFLCVRVPLAYLFSRVMNYGLTGIWAAFIFSHVVAVCSAAILYLITKNRGVTHEYY